MPMMKNREYRGFEFRAAEKKDDYIVEGYAMKWEPYALYEDERGNAVFEEFKREAFADTDMSDVIMQLNHEGTVMARLRNNTLHINLDDIGMHIRADLSKSQDARNLFEAIDNGLIDRMSWGFFPGEYHFDRKSNTIIHTRIKKVFDISAVSLPANEGTSINSVRSYIDGEIEKMTQELRAHEEAKDKLLRALKKGELLKCLSV